MANIHNLIAAWQAKAKQLAPAKAAQIHALLEGFKAAHAYLVASGAAEEEQAEMIELAEETLLRVLPKHKPVSAKRYQFAALPKRIDSESKLWDLLDTKESVTISRARYSLLRLGDKEYALISVSHSPQGQAEAAVVRQVKKI